MKKSLTILVLFLVINMSNSKSYSQKNLKQEPLIPTPKANDLKNHYGSETYNSNYSSNTRDIENFVKSNLAEIIPSKNKKDLTKDLEKDAPIDNNLIPTNIKSGSFSNQANSAEKIINPEIIPATLNIKTQVNYPKVVEFSEFKGFKNSVKEVNVHDKELNSVRKEKVLVSEPVYERQREVVEIPTKFEANIDITSNKLISVDPEEHKKVLLGIDENEEPANKK